MARKSKQTEPTVEPIVSSKDIQVEHEVKPRVRTKKVKNASIIEEEPISLHESVSVTKSSGITLEELDKSNIWTLDERELFNIYSEGRKNDSFTENEVHYMNIIRPVFEFLFCDLNDTIKRQELESQGFYIFPIASTNTANAVAIRRRPIKKITDLNLENVFFVEPKEILRLIDENMGTGWQGLPLAVQDIITAAFYVDCSIMPEFALHRPGGIIEKRVDNGYEVLEIPRGSWIEAVFIKVKPKQEKLHFEAISDKPIKKKRNIDDEAEEDDEEDDDIIDDEEEEEDDDSLIEQDEDNPNIEDLDDMIDPSTEDDNE